MNTWFDRRTLPTFHELPYSFVCSLLLAISLQSSCLTAKAQDGWTDEMSAGERITGPSGVLTGPYGRPRMVLDEFGSLKPALRVYADSAIEAYIPDITSTGWAAWHAVEFRQQGTYTVMLYTYAKSFQRTTRELVTVDTRKEIATVREGIWGNPMQVSLKTNPPRMARVFVRISELVKNQVATYHGITAQDALAQDRIMAGKMAAGSMPDNSQYPSSVASKGENSSVYKLGNGVSPPTLVYSVDPQYTEAARQQKIGGDVVVDLIIDEHGLPTNVHIQRGIDNDAGLNQKAVECVEQYRFKPAMANGMPVKVELAVKIQFQPF